MKVYNNSPLPFLGQKRFMIKLFQNALKKFDDVDTIVDVFGGSGLLSHVAKRERPDARVIYNDFDYFTDRIANIAITNEIIAKIDAIISKEKLKPSEQLPLYLRSAVLNLIAEYDSNVFVDYLTISSNLLFSMTYALCYEELSRYPMYPRLKKISYCADGFLDGLEVRHQDYRELIAEFEGNKRTLFIFDPPYLSTVVRPYMCSWRLRDYLDLLLLLDNKNFIFFTSEKTQLLELCQWHQANKLKENPFAAAEILKKSHGVGNIALADLMLVKKVFPMENI